MPPDRFVLTAMRRLFSLLILLLLCAPVSAQQFYVSAYASQRGVLNVPLFFGSGEDYAFIDFIQGGSGMVSPNGANWSATTQVWNSSILDAKGYPCTNQVTPTTTGCNYGNGVGISTVNPGSGHSFGGSVFLPASSNFSGPYCITGSGTGTITVAATGGGSWSAGSTTCVNGLSCPQNATFSGTTLTTTDESWAGWCIALTRTGGAPAGGSSVIVITTTDPNSSGHYIKDLKWYEQVDSADLAAGNIFRSAYKQPIVDYDPGYVRFMNWNLGGSTSVDSRFSDRATPINEISYSGVFSLWTPFIPYTTTSCCAGGVPNQFTLAAVATGPKQTPAAMTHGERAGFRAGATGTGAGNFAASTSAVTNVSIAGTTVTATMASTASFTTGDTLVIAKTPSTIANLNFYPAANVTVIDGTHFSFVFANAASLSTCSSNCGNVSEFYTMNVGGRGAYPIIDQQATPYAYFSGITTGTYYNFCFNKNIANQQDGSGNWIYGAWVRCMSSSGADTTIPAVPPEIAVALVNELNAMRPTYPINMWVNTPKFGLICSAYYSDPDCSSQDDFPVGMLNVILNGANGYPGLCSQCVVQFEDENETWNTGGAYTETPWFGFLGQMPSVAGHIGCGEATYGDYNTFSTLHSMLVSKDIRTSGLFSTRVRTSLSGQAVTGFAPGSLNYQRATGIGLALSGCTPAAPNAVPMNLMDAFNVAPYMVASSATFNTYIGTAAVPGTDVAGWITAVQTFGYASSQAQAYLTDWSGRVQTDGCPGSCSGDTIQNLEAIMTGLAALVVTYGTNKVADNYEGGNNEPIILPLVSTAIACTGGVTTVTSVNGYTASPGVGGTVQVYGALPAGFNGLFTLASTSASNFTFNQTCPAASATLPGFNTTATNAFLLAVQSSAQWATQMASWSAYPIGNPNLGGLNATYVENGYQFGFATPDSFLLGVLPSPSPATITALSCSGGVVTVTATNNYASGQNIRLYDNIPIGYNTGLQTLASASGSGFTYNVTTCPGVATSFGFATTEGAGLYPAWQSVGVVNQQQGSPLPVTYYLAPAGLGGSDANNGLSSGAPWLTPNHTGLKCGDKIIMAASTAYASSNFARGQWGKPLVCPSAAGVYAVTLQCAGPNVSSCQINDTTSAYAAVAVSASNWAVIGMEASSTNGGCFTTTPNSAATIHHVIFANVWCPNSTFSGISASGYSGNYIYGVDYVAFVGTAAFNTGTGSAECFSGYSDYEPAMFDTVAGTHRYFQQAFAFNSLNPNPCAGGFPSDGNGFLFDNYSNSQNSGIVYTQQTVLQDGIFSFNGGNGVQIGQNTGAPIYIKNITSYGNNQKTNGSPGNTISDLQYNGTQKVQVTNSIFQSIFATQSEVGGSDTVYTVYSYLADATDLLQNSYIFGVAGQQNHNDNNAGFVFPDTGITQATPNFVNPIAAISRHCNSPLVTTCMATEIANYTPQAAGALALGYKVPGACAPDALWPVWLNHLLPVGLVQQPCGTN